MLAFHPSDTSAAALPRPQGKLQPWFGAFADGEAAASRHLPVLRFAVLNLVALALLGAAGCKAGSPWCWRATVRAWWR
jgi:hypothetical protein